MDRTTARQDAWWLACARREARADAYWAAREFAEQRGASLSHSYGWSGLFTVTIRLPNGLSSTAEVYADGSNWDEALTEAFRRPVAALSGV